MKMKRLSAMLLVIVVVFSMTTTAFASETANMSSGTDTSVELIASESFQSVFDSPNTARNAEPEPVIDSVSYNYSLTPQQNNPLLAEVVLAFTMLIDSKTYPVYATGLVDAYQISDGDTLWEGLLRGRVEINETTYKVLVGFAKLDSSADIQVSVTIQALDNTDAIAPIIFMFGNNVINMEIYEELAEDTHKISTRNLSGELELEPASATSAGTFTYVGYDYAYFDGGANISGYAQRSRGYFNSDTNQFAVTIKSYCNNVDDFFAVGGFSVTTIKSFAIELVRDSGYSTGSFSYIIGTEKYDFDVGDLGSAALIKPLFDDIMGLLGVPTSTISAIFDGLKGSVEEDFHANDTTVSVSFGLLQSANFDDSGVGVPIVFQLGRNSGYTGNSSYTFVTSITYRTTYMPTGSTTAGYIYTDGYDTSKTVTITLA